MKQMKVMVLVLVVLAFCLGMIGKSAVAKQNMLAGLWDKIWQGESKKEEANVLEKEKDRRESSKPILYEKNMTEWLTEDNLKIAEQNETRFNKIMKVLDRNPDILEHVNSMGVTLDFFEILPKPATLTEIETEDTEDKDDGGEEGGAFDKIVKSSFASLTNKRWLELTSELELALAEFEYLYALNDVFFMDSPKFSFFGPMFELFVYTGVPSHFVRDMKWDLKCVNNCLSKGNKSSPDYQNFVDNCFHNCYHPCFNNAFGPFLADLQKYYTYNYKVPYSQIKNPLGLKYVKLLADSARNVKRIDDLLSTIEGYLTTAVKGNYWFDKRNDSSCQQDKAVLDWKKALDEFKKSTRDDYPNSGDDAKNKINKANYFSYDMLINDFTKGVHNKSLSGKCLTAFMVDILPKNIQEWKVERTKYQKDDAEISRLENDFEVASRGLAGVPNRIGGLCTVPRPSIPSYVSAYIASFISTNLH